MAPNETKFTTVNYEIIDQWQVIAMAEDSYNGETFITAHTRNGYESRTKKPEKRHDAQPWTKDARYKYCRKK